MLPTMSRLPKQSRFSSFSGNSRIEKYLPWLLPGMFFLVFWFFRSVQLGEGSADLWLREVEGGVWFRKRRMLSFFLYQLSYKTGGYLLGWDGRYAMHFLACLAGSIFVYYLYRICERWGVKGWIPFGLVMSSGFTVLFYGFLETYALVIAASAMFFYYLFGYCEGKNSPLAPALAYSLAAWCHLQVGFYFPVLVLAWWLKGHKRDEIITWVQGLIPLAVLMMGITWLNWGAGDFFENIHWMSFHPQPGRPEDYTYLGKAYWKNILYFQCRISLFSIPLLLLLPLVHGKRAWNPVEVPLLLLATLGTLGLMLTHYPDNNPQVWTVFALYGFPATLLAGYWLMKTPYASIPSLLMIGISFFLTGRYLIQNSQLFHRGEGQIVLEKVPSDALILLDGYQKKPSVSHILEGTHVLKIIKKPYIISTTLQVLPNSCQTVDWKQKQN